MFASTVSLLLSSSGSRGTDVLRALMKITPDLMSRFVSRRSDVAGRWVKSRPNARQLSSVELRKADIDSIYGDTAVETLSEELGMDEAEVVRLLNNALYEGARLAAPNGERVSERAVKRLDEDLKNAIL